MTEKIVIKEIAWIISIIALAIAIFGSVVGFGEILKNKTYDVQIFDTYTVGKAFDLTAIIFTSIAFVAYALRGIINKFRNKPVNIILGIISI